MTTVRQLLGRKDRAVFSVGPEAPVLEAIRAMAEHHIGALLVMKGEVLAGIVPGRRDDSELTLFRSLGLAIEDLAAAQLAVAEATGQDLGTEVEL